MIYKEYSISTHCFLYVAGKKESIKINVEYIVYACIDSK